MNVLKLQLHICNSSFAGRNNWKKSKFYLPTDAQLNCLKNNFKIDIKTAPTCFGVITIIRGSTIQSC